MKKRRPNLEQCTARVIIGPFGKHYAKLVAIDADGRQHYIQWLSRSAAEEIIFEFEI